MIDRCVEWNPIPEEANRYPDLTVLKFQTHSDSDGRLVVSMVVMVPKNETPLLHHRTDAWLITFEKIRAFRYRMFPASGEDSPFICPDCLKHAAWEVFPSTWAAQGGPFPNFPMSHFVIVDEYMAWEILAVDWKSEQLPDSWQQQYPIFS